jgi:PhoH-like ATPase
MKIDISNLDKYSGRVKTDSGYIEFDNIPTKFEHCYEMAFSNNLILKVSYNHLFEDINGNWILAEKLNYDTPILASGGIVYLLNRKYIGKNEVYDINVKSDKHQYYLDSLSSHNSGKTLLAMSAAMELIKRKDFQRIVYIRNSVESLAKGEDVGYLSGNDEKFEIYNFPLFDTLAYIASKMISKSNQNKQGKGKTDNIPTEELISEKVEQLVERFQVETMWTGALRGRTISNAIIIIDEAQNMSNSTLQLTLTRIDATCKVIVLGSNRQIDNAYITKHTNGLTTLLNATKEEHKNINLFGIELHKVLRGPITQFAEKVFT